MMHVVTRHLTFYLVLVPVCPAAGVNQTSLVPQTTPAPPQTRRKTQLKRRRDDARLPGNLASLAMPIPLP